MRLLRVLALSALLGAGLAPPMVAQASTVAEPAETFYLSVYSIGDGTGTVTSSPAGIDCGEETFDCFAEFEAGTEVTLSAAADELSTFVGWDGACSGPGDCVVTMNEDVDVYVDFDALLLDVTLDGDGEGAVTSDPAGITCDWDVFDCWERYPAGTEVTLTATAMDEVSIFVGWDGACSGTGECTVTVNEDVEVIATFDTAWLEVEPIGDGTGVVVSDPAGIECGYESSPCAAAYLPGTTVTLTASPADDSVFTGWGEACTGTQDTCTVTMDEDVFVSSAFDTAYVTVSRAGDGGGTVTSATGGLSCPPTCFERYLPGSEVTLTATPAANAIFTDWDADCAGTNPVCVLVAGDDVHAEATFDTGRVNVSTNGDGTGSITSTPAGIGCPNDCRESYLPGTQITLAAAPTGGESVFLGWSGDCTGTGDCVVDAGSDPTVRATFDTARLRVHREGPGAGSVTSDPAGIDCGSDCFDNFLPSSTVTLTATPHGGTFIGWSGACSGTGDCVIDMSDDLEVTATFLPQGTGGKIAYACDADICVINDDGTGQVNLTNSPEAQEYAPTLSKDGTKIAFMSNAPLTDNPDRNLEIATINVDGTGLFQVTNSSGVWESHHNYDPDWSPDGTKIAYVTTRDGGTWFRQIFTINADGTDEQMISDPADQATRLGPKWSPDGTKIAYTWWLGWMDVHVMDADGSNETKLTLETSDEKSPAWSPDGTRIAFGTDRHYDPMTFNEEIYIMNADGSNQVRLTETREVEESPAWSPDGQWIAFSRYGDIYAIQAPPPGARQSEVGQLEERQLTSGPAQDYEPFWAGTSGALPTAKLKVIKTGNGKGTVTSSPGGIRCGRDCSESFTVDSRITLTAQPAEGSVVRGWNRICATTTTCTVSLDQARRIKVRFDRPTISPPKGDVPVTRSSTET